MRDRYGFFAGVACVAVVLASMAQIHVGNNPGSSGGGWDAISCTAGQYVSAVSAAGVATCSTPPGALVKLDEAVASSSATLTLTNLSASYDVYELHFYNMVPGTTSTDLRLTVSTDGGSSYRAGTDYVYANKRLSSDASDSNEYSSGTSSISLYRTLGVNLWDTGGVLNGTLRHYRGTADQQVFTGDMVGGNGVGTTLGIHVVSGVKTATAVTHIRLASSSGNIASGRVRLYGIAK